MDDIEERIMQFRTLTLPGQPQAMHVGTLTLVADLWREVQELRKRDLFKAVGEFHSKFNLPTVPGALLIQLNTLFAENMLEFRHKFMTEELLEFEQSWDNGDITGMADALADLVYVALGTAHMMGIPFDAIWAEVQRANMTKERSTGADDPRSKRGSALDVVKPEGWTAPDHGPALRAVGWRG